MRQGGAGAGVGTALPEGCFEDGSRVGDFQEILRVWLNLNELALWERGVLELDNGALLEEEILHHPVRDIARALLRVELHDAAVGNLIRIRGIANLEHHWILDVHFREAIEGRRRQNNLQCDHRFGYGLRVHKGGA